MHLNKIELIEFLKQEKLFLTKNRGQNFLVDKNIHKKIAEIVPNKNNVIIEIGAGLGHLTQILEHKTKHLFCIEIDKGFITFLQKKFPYTSIIHNDILKLSINDIIGHLLPIPYIVCGNIPYHISTKICEHILNFDIRPNVVFLTTEKQYAKDKILNSSHLLYKKISYFYHIESVLPLSRDSFFPIPKKDSLLIKWTHKTKSVIKTALDHKFFYYIDKIYSHPKKTIKNKLEIYYNLSKDFYKKNEPYLKLRVHEITEENLYNLFTDIIEYDKNGSQK